MESASRPSRPSRPGRLQAVKIAHTIVWALLVACIAGIPISAWQRSFGWTAALIGIIVLEGVVLVANGWRCPLTDIAARYTDDRADNFDIYLPLWLARHNKLIFTTIFVFAVLFSALQWAR
jgi:hypothetical protein